jgi:hypothetical protein
VGKLRREAGGGAERHHQIEHDQLAIRPDPRRVEPQQRGGGVYLEECLG